MRKTISILSIFLMTFVLFTIAILAEEKDETKVTGKIVSGAQDIKVDAKSSKFFEYRDVPMGFTFGVFNVSIEKREQILKFQPLQPETEGWKIQSQFR
jgi:hypothetical protein